VGPLRSHAGELVTDESGMGEIFVQAFSSVFVREIPSEVFPFQTFDGYMEDVMLEYGSLKEILKNLDASTSAGMDGVHPSILKHCADTVAVPLLLIFQKSLSSSELPSAWKMSRVVPIFKSGVKSNPLNYRPVSLTSNCCKVMERLLAAHILDYLESNDLLSNSQFGFRKHRGTEDQLLLTYCDVVEGVDSGAVVDMIFLDFSKAFDVVSHGVLLGKLRALGFCRQVLAWIEGFLCGRSMLVSVGGTDSSSVDVLSGVPQGSVLGPLLFLIYVNSLAGNLDCRWTAFADDFKLYGVFNRDDGSRISLQSDLENLATTASSWNLKLNASKCVVMTFGGRSSDTPAREYQLGESVLRRVDNHTDLGVMIDSALKFHDHISCIVRKSSGLMNQLLRATVCRDRDFMITLYICVSY